MRFESRRKQNNCRTQRTSSYLERPFIQYAGYTVRQVIEFSLIHP